MPGNTEAFKGKASKPVWYQGIRKYEKPDLSKAIWQLLNTFIPYFLILYLMYLTIQSGYSYWITLALAVPAAGFLGRIFIFFHDCVHSSFFASRKANTILGRICGILTFTTYEDWRRAHGIHHATVGDLDRRSVGDIWTLTVDEFLTAHRPRQIRYRIFRNPLVIFGLGPAYEFLISHRFSHKGARKSERYGVYFNNLAILAIIVAAGLTIGFRTYVLIQLPVIIFCGLMALWVFYIQHQFAGVYWARHEGWDPIQIAMQGSSYYKLPRLLQWFSGNIGYHHIHHIRPRIPNYNLQRCYDETPAMRNVEPLTIRKSLKSPFLHLWDENRKKLVSFRSLKDLLPQKISNG
ncbi:MAG: fatty acid desaturase [Desulfobacterales bacterium]|nr:fatty acid desaturase [Desulfobacterales bacterium]